MSEMWRHIDILGRWIRPGRIGSQLSGARALLLALLPARGGAGEGYPLGPEDQVRVKIYEWRASRDTIFEWSALNDTFTVGADGALSLPFAGRVPAEGLDTEALAAAIAGSLARNMGLGQEPDVAVEVTRFRPFYIFGDVAHPGEFPYRPGLDVLKAVSVAGGLPARGNLASLGREIVSGRGDLAQLRLTRVSLLARRARLAAESAGAGEIAFPAELTRAGADAAAEVLMEQERALFDTRRQGLDTQLRALGDLRGFLDREIASLGRQIGFLDQQMASVEQELGSVTELVGKGLAAAPRQLGLERSVLQLRGDRLTLETALLRARQEASRTELSLLDLRNTRTSEVAGELRETELALSEAERKTDTALLLLHDSEEAAPRFARRAPVYTILRPDGAGGASEIAAGETTELRPGDTLKVEVPLPGDPVESDRAAGEGEAALIR